MKEVTATETLLEEEKQEQISMENLSMEELFALLEGETSPDASSKDIETPADDDFAKKLEALNRR